MSLIQEEEVWKLLENYFQTHGIIQHQLDTFDEYIHKGISNIIEKEADIVFGNYKVTFSGVYIPRPTIIDENRILRNVQPYECRLRDLTYDSPIYVDVLETTTNDAGEIVDQKFHNRVILARTPIMVQSTLCNLMTLTSAEKVKNGECKNDNGGYFIIKGKERVLVAQVRGIYNQVMVFDQKTIEKYKLIAEVRSMSDETAHSVLIQCKISKDESSIVFTIPYTKQPIPVGILFKALGFLEKEDIRRAIAIPVSNAREEFVALKFYETIFRESFSVKTQEEALNYIGQYAIHIIKEEKRVDYAWQVVDTELLPHLGVSASVKDKLFFLGSMVQKLLLTVMGKRNVDDRDNYKNKRVEMAGVLCHDLFRTLYKRYIKSLISQLEKKKFTPDIITLMTRNSSITTGLRHCFAVGSWGLPKNAFIRNGVSQVLSRLSYGAALSHLRRIVLPIGKEAKNTKIRQINQSQIMFICPVETPEGAGVGVVLNLALLTTVSNSIPKNFIRDILDKIPIMKSVDSVSDAKDLIKIFLNGVIIGFVREDEKEDFLDLAKYYRSTKIIPKSVSISFDAVDREIRVFCDEGRLLRPLFTVSDEGVINFSLDKNPDWNCAVSNGCIQYLDNIEIEDYEIAMNSTEVKKGIKFCEISPSMMLGVMAASIPFPAHSQAPRNCYMSSMGKQSLGVFALSYKHRSDTTAHVLDYPQRPLISTRAAEFMGFNDMPSGINAMVAIMCYSGYNQEDSVIINKGAIDRGLFSVTSYRTLVIFEKKRGTSTSTEQICKPPENIRRKDVNYDLLDERGIVRVGVPVFKGDVVVGKIVSNNKNESDSNDCSLVVKHNEEGIVDRVEICTTPSGYKLVKVIVRHQKIPEVGDKFSSRAAQKGTCGAIFAQEDMPFTKDGMTPDIIINSHCIPSRMTINQLMESVFGKACALRGEFGDATPFTTSTSNDFATKICDMFSDSGFDKFGREVFYNGFNGDLIEAQVFFGPVYYQRLKHMVSDKMHSRNSGLVTTLTRQPLEGRSRDGGLRFGEMERDCIISHGASRFLKERLFDQSDPYQVDICGTCGTFGTIESTNGAATTEGGSCFSCMTNSKISRINLPYAAKLLIQELNTMGIKTFLQTK